MTAQVILTDLKTDGAVPVESEITVDYGAESEFLNLKFDALDLEISIAMYYIGMVLGNEEYG